MEVSFEFYPPKTEKGLEKLLLTAEKFAAVKPNYFSVTFGAGGSTREHTPNTVKAIQEKTQIPTAPHISCVSSSREALIDLLQHYKSIGVKRLVVLRGDKPSGMGIHHGGAFRYAYQLVELIRHETGDHFHISVAAYPETHPESKNFKDELIHFKQKVDCGADQAITQYFYNADAYFHFVDCCLNLGINIPIVPGIMPLTNYDNIVRFSAMCGAEIPLWIRKHCEAFGEDSAAIKQFGFEITQNLCQTLVKGGAPGLHFYSLNQTDPSLKLYNALKR